MKSSESEDISKDQLHDSRHGIMMGVPSVKCDNGKTNLSIDWDENPINKTCYEDKHEYLPNADVFPTLTCDNIPRNYVVSFFFITQHLCV